MKSLVLILGLVIALPVSAQTEKTRETLVQKLKHLRVTIHFDEAPLEDVVEYIRDATGINFVLHHSLLHSPGISIRLTNVRLKSALRLMLVQHGLTAVYRDGVLYIVPQAGVRRKVSTRVYDVRDLLLKIRDFPGPEIKLAEGDPGIEPVVIPDWDPPRERVDRELLVDMISANTGGVSWDADENSSVNLVNGLLIVAQSGSVHAEIQELLNRLRQAR